MFFYTSTRDRLRPRGTKAQWYVSFCSVSHQIIQLHFTTQHQRDLTTKQFLPTAYTSTERRQEIVCVCVHARARACKFPRRQEI